MNTDMSTAVPTEMTGVVLPGNSTVQHRTFAVPRPGPRQVLVRVRASSICGSDIRAIYREHLGKGPEAFVAEAPLGVQCPLDGQGGSDRHRGNCGFAPAPARTTHCDFEWA